MRVVLHILRIFSPVFVTIILAFATLHFLVLLDFPKSAYYLSSSVFIILLMVSLIICWSKWDKEQE